MAQYYSFLLCKELKWLLAEERHLEQFLPHFGIFWVRYYSLYSM